MNDLSKYYIDLKKCTEEQRKHIISLLPEPEVEQQYIIGVDFKYLHYDGDFGWWVYKEFCITEKTKLTYPEFIKMFQGGEGETLRQQFESEIKAKGTEFLFESNNQNYITWLENKINSNK